MPTNLRLALAVLRYSLAAFLAVWVIEKFLKPDTTVAIWKAFYMTESLPFLSTFVAENPEIWSYGIGMVQAIALLAMILGFAKFWSYGFWLVAHGVGTILTYERLINPYEGVNHLFWAAVPVFGALLVLFLLRKEDTLWTIER